MPTFEVELDNGEIYEVEADREPTHEELYKALGIAPDTGQGAAQSFVSKIPQTLVGMTGDAVAFPGAVASIFPGMEDNASRRAGQAIKQLGEEMFPTNPALEGSASQDVASAIGQAIGILTPMVGARAAGFGSKAIQGLGLGAAGVISAEPSAELADLYGATGPGERAWHILGGIGREVGTEALLGGVGRSAFSRALAGDIRAVLRGKAGKQALKTIASEAGEEAVSGIIEPIQTRLGVAGLEGLSPSTETAPNGVPLPDLPYTVEGLKDVGWQSLMGAVGGTVFALPQYVSLKQTPKLSQAVPLYLQTKKHLEDLQAKGEEVPQELTESYTALEAYVQANGAKAAVNYAAGLKELTDPKTSEERRAELGQLVSDYESRYLELAPEEVEGFRSQILANPELDADMSDAADASDYVTEGDDPTDAVIEGLNQSIQQLNANPVVQAASPVSQTRQQAKAAAAKTKTQVAAVAPVIENAAKVGPETVAVVSEVLEQEQRQAAATEQENLAQQIVPETQTKKPDATQTQPIESSVQAERPSGDQGGQAAEAGSRDSLQRSATGQEKIGSTPSTPARTVGRAPFYVPQSGPALETVKAQAFKALRKLYGKKARGVTEGTGAGQVTFTTAAEQAAALPETDKTRQQIETSGAEGYMDRKTGRIYIFTDRVFVTNAEVKAARKVGVLPQSYALARLLAHEGTHPLTAAIQRQRATVAQMEATELEQWRKDNSELAKLLDEYDAIADELKGDWQAIRYTLAREPGLKRSVLAQTEANIGADIEAARAKIKGATTARERQAAQENLDTLVALFNAGNKLEKLDPGQVDHLIDEFLSVMAEQDMKALDAAFGKDKSVLGRLWQWLKRVLSFGMTGDPNAEPDLDRIGNFLRQAQNIITTQIDPEEKPADEQKKDEPRFSTPAVETQTPSSDATLTDKNTQAPTDIHGRRVSSSQSRRAYDRFRTMGTPDEETRGALEAVGDDLPEQARILGDWLETRGYDPVDVNRIFGVVPIRIGDDISVQTRGKWDILGIGSEGVVIEDKDDPEVVYKVFVPWEGPDDYGFGISPHLILKEGKVLVWQYTGDIFAPIQKARFISGIGGVPQEFHGLDPDGYMVIKMPRGTPVRDEYDVLDQQLAIEYPDAAQRPKPESPEYRSKLKVERSKFRERLDDAVKRHGLIRVSDSEGVKLERSLKDGVYIGVLDGTPYLVTDVRFENVLEDNQQQLRIADAAVTEIKPEFYDAIPELKAVIERVRQQETEMDEPRSEAAFSTPEELERDFEFIVERDEDDEGTFVTVRSRSEKNALGGPLDVAHLHVPDDNDRGEKWYAGDVYVREDLRRRGIARRMYQVMSEHLGKPPEPASFQSPDGAEMWKNFRFSTPLAQAASSATLKDDQGTKARKDQGDGRTGLRTRGRDGARLPDPAGVPDDWRGRRVRLTHWSVSPALRESDPAFHGTGGIGAEKLRRKSYPELYVPRTYFGYGKYRREVFIGGERYTAEIEGDRIYNLDSDPLDLYPDSAALRAAGFAPFDQQAAITMFERRMRDAGYSGYRSKNSNAVALFDKARLTKVSNSDKSEPDRFSTPLASEPAGTNLPANDTRGTTERSPQDRAPEEGRRDRGGVAGTRGVLEEPGRALAAGEPLRGLTGKAADISIPGRGIVTFGPFETARETARRYMERAGLPYNPPTTYQKVSPERAKRIADAYEAMPHDPTDPEVAAAYEAMIRETVAQWEAIMETGLKVEPMPVGQDPYEATPRLAVLDVIENNHMYFFPTTSGFGSGEAISDNPLENTKTGIVINGMELVANDLFRVVHDYFGHIKEGVGFRADGEENAWRSHSAMYSPLARKAMTTETRGQNSWLNFGPHGEANRKAVTADTVFAPQKIGLLPQWVVEDGAGDRFSIPSEDRRLEEEIEASETPTSEVTYVLEEFRAFQRQLPSGISIDVGKSTEAPDQITIHNIDVVEEDRGKGLASKVLRELIRLADENGVSIDLEVGYDDAGIGLVDWYTRHGFKFEGNDNFMTRRPDASRFSTPLPAGASRYDRTTWTDNDVAEWMKDARREKYDELVDFAQVMGTRTQTKYLREGVAVMTDFVRRELINLTEDGEGLVRLDPITGETEELPPLDQEHVLAYIKLAKKLLTNKTFAAKFKDRFQKFHAETVEAQVNRRKVTSAIDAETGQLETITKEWLENKDYAIHKGSAVVAVLQLELMNIAQRLALSLDVRGKPIGGPEYNAELKKLELMQMLMPAANDTIIGDYMTIRDAARALNVRSLAVQGKGFWRAIKLIDRARREAGIDTGKRGGLNAKQTADLIDTLSTELGLEKLPEIVRENPVYAKLEELVQAAFDNKDAQEAAVEEEELDWWAAAVKTFADDERALLDEFRLLMEDIAVDAKLVGEGPGASSVPDPGTERTHEQIVAGLVEKRKRAMNLLKKVFVLQEKREARLAKEARKKILTEKRLALLQPDAQARKLIDKYVNAPVVKARAKAANPVKDALTKQIRNPVADDEFVIQLRNLGLDEQTAGNLSSVANEKIAERREKREADKASKNTDVANDIIDAIDKQFTEWVPADAKQKNEVRRIQRAALVDQRTQPDRVGRLTRDRFIEEYSKSLTDVGVDATVAYNLAARLYAENTKLAANAEQSRRARMVGSSKFLNALIKEIYTTPLSARGSGTYAEDQAVAAFRAAGLPADKARQAAQALTLAVRKAQEKAQLEALERSAAKLKLPRPTIEALKQAIRSGLFNPADPVASALAKMSGFKELSLEDYKRLAEADDMTRGTSSEAAKGQAAMLRIIRKSEPPRRIRDMIYAAWVPDAISGMSNYMLNTTSPAFTTARNAFVRMIEVVTDAVRGKTDVGQAAYRIGGIFSGINHGLKEMLAQLKFAAVHDAYKSRMAEHIASLDALVGQTEKSAEMIRKAIADKNPKNLLLGSIRYLYSTVNLIRRSFSTIDQAWASGLARQTFEYEVFRELMTNNKLRPAEVEVMMAEAHTLAEKQLLEKQEARLAAGMEPMDRVTANAVKHDLFQEVLITQMRNKLGNEKGGEIATGAQKDADMELGNRGSEDAPGLDIFNNFIEMIKKGALAMRKTKGDDKKAYLQVALSHMITGFISVPANVLNRSFYFTPVGTLRALYKLREFKTDELTSHYNETMATKRQAETRLIESLIGTFLMMVYAALKLSEDDDEEPWGLTINGAGPQDQKLRDAWLKKGHRQNSIELKTPWGNVSVPWGRGGFEGVSLAMVPIAAIEDMKLNGIDPDKGENVGRYMSAMWGAMSSQAKFFGLKTSADVIHPTDQNIVSKVSYSLSPFVPFSGLIKSIGKALGEDSPLDNSSPKGAFMASTPVSGIAGTARVNVFGEDMGDLSWFNKSWFAGVPLAFSSGESPSNEDLYAYVLRTGISPSIPSRSNLERSNGTLTDERWHGYAVMRGQMVKAEMRSQLRRLIFLDREDAERLVENISSDATLRVKKKLGLK